MFVLYRNGVEGSVHVLAKCPRLPQALHSLVAFVFRKYERSSRAFLGLPAVRLNSGGTIIASADSLPLITIDGMGALYDAL